MLHRSEPALPLPQKDTEAGRLSLRHCQIEDFIVIEFRRDDGPGIGQGAQEHRLLELAPGLAEVDPEVIRAGIRRDEILKPIAVEVRGQDRLWRSSRRDR